MHAPCPPHPSYNLLEPGATCKDPFWPWGHVSGCGTSPGVECFELGSLKVAHFGS